VQLNLVSARWQCLIAVTVLQPLATTASRWIVIVLPRSRWVGQDANTTPHGKDQGAVTLFPLLAPSVGRDASTSIAIAMHASLKVVALGARGQVLPSTLDVGHSDAVGKILSQAAAYLPPLTTCQLARRSLSGGTAPVGFPVTSSTPSSSTSARVACFAPGPGHHTSLKPTAAPNCTWHTSLGGSSRAPSWHVHQLPDPSSPTGRDASCMPAPSGLRKAIPSTRPRFSRWALLPCIVQQST